VTLKLVAAMRRAFPIQGQPWEAVDEEERVALQPFLGLLPAFSRYWLIKYPAAEMVVGDKIRKVDGLSAYKPLEPTPDDPKALHDLVRHWRAVFRHYQWGSNGVFPFEHPLCGWLDRRSTRWAWPEVPEISPELLGNLEKAARALLGPGVEDKKNPPADQPAPRVLEFRPGEIVFRGHAVELKGKPWQILQAIATAPGCVKRADDLLKEIWGDKLDSIEQTTLSFHVCTARKALRKVITAAGLQPPDDPLPAVDRGHGLLAWKLELPEEKFPI
jgi:hypothetical protein